MPNHGLGFAFATFFGVLIGFAVGFFRNRDLAAREKMWDQASTELMSLIEALRQENASLASAHAQEQRKAQGYFATIEGVIGERQTWENLYRQQAIEHGNAQALMMNDNAYLRRRLREAGVEIKSSPLLDEVFQLYQEHHIEPLLRKGPDTIPEPLPKPLSKPIETLSDGVQGVSVANLGPGSTAAGGALPGNTFTASIPPSLDEAVFPRKVT